MKRLEVTQNDDPNSVVALLEQHDAFVEEQKKWRKNSKEYKEYNRIINNLRKEYNKQVKREDLKVIE